MSHILNLYNAIFASLNRLTERWLLPTAARLVFAGVLLVYYLNSAMTKVGDGVLGFLKPSFGAYGQIFPKALEATGYDASQLSSFHTVVVLLGTWAEFLLPVAIILGLFTRLAALGMIGFVTVQSYVDIFGHEVDGKTIGTWFDGNASALIFDQRAFWLLALAILVLRGPGTFSLDRLFGIDRTR